jgi:hypothetical protein
MVIDLSLSGAITGLVNSPDVLGTVTLGGSGPISVFGCTAPFSALNGKTATISGLSVTLP